MDNLESEIERRMKICDAATPGPWKRHPRAWASVCAADDASEWSGEILAACGSAQRNFKVEEQQAAQVARADFIAHARTGYPAALEALRVAVKALEAIVDNSLHPQTLAARCGAQALAAIKHALGAGT